MKILKLIRWSRGRSHVGHARAYHMLMCQLTFKEIESKEDTIWYSFFEILRFIFIFNYYMYLISMHFNANKHGQIRIGKYKQMKAYEKKPPMLWNPIEKKPPMHWNLRKETELRELYISLSKETKKKKKNCDEFRYFLLYRFDL